MEMVGHPCMYFLTNKHFSLKLQNGGSNVSSTRKKQPVFLTSEYLAKLIQCRLCF